MNWKALPPEISSKKFVQNSDGSYVLKYKIRNARFVASPPKKNIGKMFMSVAEAVSAIPKALSPISNSRTQVLPVSVGKRNMMKVLNTPCYKP